MEVKINKEIRNYTESMFFGLSMRQFIFSVLACGVAVALYFLLRPYFGTEGKHCNDSFSVAEAFQILKSVKQEGIWATRVSFVYSVNENRVYYVENNDFEYVTKYQFCNSY